MKIEEFNIPVPWGHIAVKAWGNSNDTPILVTHGRMDNAGSFDKLIPLLPKVFYYICIDLPSHGRSSPLPPFAPIHTINFVMVYKSVLDYFKRGKYILMAHSYGACIGQFFATLYPEYVKKIIHIDCIITHYIEPSQIKKYLTANYNNLINIYQKEKSARKPTYTEEEIIEKIKNGRLNEPLNVEAARCLARRMLEPAGNGRFTLSTDYRMKAYMDPPLSFNYIRETFKHFPVSYPYLIIIAKQSPLIISNMHPLLKDIEKWGNSKIVLLDNGHDVHINHPEIVASYITEFLLEMEGKL